jgi:hypothetical protein
MLGDRERGWAWTRALLGVPANEVHVCGDAAAVPLVTRMAAATGEALEVRPPRAARIMVACPGTCWARALQQRGPCGLPAKALRMTLRSRAPWGADTRQQAARRGRA